MEDYESFLDRCNRIASNFTKFRAAEVLPQVLRPDRRRMEPALNVKPSVTLSRSENSDIKWEERAKLGDWPELDTRVNGGKGTKEDLERMQKLGRDIAAAKESKLAEKRESKLAEKRENKRESKREYNREAKKAERERNSASGNVAEKEQDRLRKQQQRAKEAEEKGIVRRKYEKSSDLTDDEKLARKREKNRLKQQKFRESKKKSQLE